MLENKNIKFIGVTEDFLKKERLFDNKKSSFQNEKNNIFFNKSLSFSKKKEENVLYKNVFICYLNVTINNIFVTLTNYKGDVLSSLSSGNLGGDMGGKKKKCSIITGRRLGLSIGNYFVSLNEDLSTKVLNLYLKCPIYNRVASCVIQGIVEGSQNKISINRIIDDYPYSHNGMSLKRRPHKKRKMKKRR